MRNAMPAPSAIFAPPPRWRARARRLARLLAMAAAFAGTAHAAGPVGDVARGQMVYARCVSCHALTGAQITGPSLIGVAGRKAGTSPGARYSPALVASGLTWKTATLDAFLAAPTQLVPGTSMAIVVPAAQDRADVIAYLKTLKAVKP
jgi:cytochrome c